MQKVVESDTPVEVGKYYNVRCAIMVCNNSYPRLSYWIPVIGEVHNDNQFNFPDKHIHIDGRFCGKVQYQKNKINSDGTTNNVLSFEKTATYQVKEIVIKKVKCKRLGTGINPPHELHHIAKKYANTWHQWARSMIGKSCEGKKCPHLGTAMVERDGVLVCPLHDLRGDIKTEKIILHPKCINHATTPTG